MSAASQPEATAITLHVKDRWKEAFLVIPNGETIFLKQENDDVREMMTSPNPADPQPMRLIISRTTVRRRVEEILREHKKELKIVPIGIRPQLISISE